MSQLALAPTQSNIFAVLRSFLLNILPGGNAIFSATIDGTIMTVLSVQAGTISVGDPIVGPNILAATVVTSLGTGAGTTGTYNIAPAPPLPVSQTMTTGVPVFQGQQNRVVESPAPDFVVMWPLFRERLETNTDNSADAKFLGSISGDTMTITTAFFGSVKIGSPVFGIGVVDGTRVIQYLNGHGEEGTYQVAPSQTIASGSVLSCGATTYLQPTQVTVQLDVHGPNSSDNAQIISTLFRDDYAVEFFQASGFDVTPFYADDPKQIAFQNAEQQWETRWVMDAVMQANQIVTVGQQYADNVVVVPKEVDATFPP